MNTAKCGLLFCTAFLTSCRATNGGNNNKSAEVDVLVSPDGEFLNEAVETQTDINDSKEGGYDALRNYLTEEFDKLVAAMPKQKSLLLAEKAAWKRYDDVVIYDCSDDELVSYPGYDVVWNNEESQSR